MKRNLINPKIKMLKTYLRETQIHFFKEERVTSIMLLHRRVAF